MIADRPDPPHSQGSVVRGNPSHAAVGVRVESELEMARRKRWIAVAVFVVLATIASASFIVVRVAANSARADVKLTHRVVRGDLVVSIVEQGALESSNNTEIKCKVRGFNTVTWVIESGSVVEPGDELFRLDTKVIEETVSLTKTNVDLARAKLERSKADFARAEIAIEAYLEGQYRSDLKVLEKGVTIAESNLLSARKMLEQSRALFRRGYVTNLEVEGHAFTVKQAELELGVKKTQVDVLQRFTKEMRLETLRGRRRAAESKKKADEAELAMTTKQRARALAELEACVTTADRAGLVIYPSAAEWKDTPDVTEGATVRKDQVLLLMPDLSRMQVKVGVHESVVDRVKAGLDARVTLPDRTLDARVTSVSTVANPTGWWTGNVVEYDCVIELPSVEGLRPGMSAEVEIILAHHTDVLTVPVAAVVESADGARAWVASERGLQPRSLRLGDTNDVFVVVEDGVAEGEDVVLNPGPLARELEREAADGSGQLSTPSADGRQGDSPPEAQEVDDVD